MQLVLHTLLEILKYTLPALIMYLVMDRFFRHYLAQQSQLQAHTTRLKFNKATLPLRLQAYERLALFCERIDLPNLLHRIPPESMHAREYQVILLLAIQKEFEHNLTQQIYVSTALWEIIQAAREDTLDVIRHAANQLSTEESGGKLADVCLHIQAQRGGSASQKALQATRQEAAILFG